VGVAHEQLVVLCVIKIGSACRMSDLHPSHLPLESVV
jgi:hypothetical protein